MRRLSVAFEGDADPLLLAPDDMTGPPRSVAGDPQREAVRKPPRAVDLERRARCGEIAHRAGKRVAAELDGPGLEHTEALRSAVFWVISRLHSSKVFVVSFDVVGVDVVST